MIRYCFSIIAFVIIGAGMAGAKPEQNYPISELYVMSADTARLDGDRLVLSGVNPNVIWIAERPARRSGRADTEVFIANWPVGNDSFDVDPPNAVLVGSADTGEVELPVELMDPEWTDSDLILRVASIGTALPESLSLSAVHLFIDNQITPEKKQQLWCGHECFLVYWPIGTPDLSEAE